MTSPIPVPDDVCASLELLTIHEVAVLPGVAEAAFVVAGDEPRLLSSVLPAPFWRLANPKRGPWEVPHHEYWLRADINRWVQQTLTPRAEP